MTQVTQQYGAVTIALNGSLSTALNTGGLRVLGVVTPAAMDGGGAMSFQGSYDGVTFCDLYTQAGVEVVTGAIAVSRYYMIAGNDMPGLNYVKVRTGATGAPITQNAARSIIVVYGT